MIQWWNGLELLGQIFALIAIPATLVLLIQTVLLFIGFGNTDDGGDLSGGMDADGDLDIDDADTDIDSDGDDNDGFTLFSVRGIVAMLCIGGWSGIALLDAGINHTLAVIFAFIFGFAALVGIAFLMKAVSKLQSSGNIDLGNAIGKTGRVYIPIPPNLTGCGKITVTVQEKLIETGAITQCERRLATGETVRVVATDETGMLVVEPLAKV